MTDTFNDIEEYEDILEHCAKNNPLHFNINKALEEAAEFVDASLKYQTKHPDNPKKPTREDILHEYADFFYRGLIMLMSLFPDKNLDEINDLIGERCRYKLDYLIDWKNNGQYQGGL